MDSISEDVPSRKSLRCPSCPCAGPGECDQVSDNCKGSPNLEEDVIAGFLQVDLGLGLAIIGWEEAEEYFGIILTLLPQFFRSLFHQFLSIEYRVYVDKVETHLVDARPSWSPAPPALPGSTLPYVSGLHLADVHHV